MKKHEKISKAAYRFFEQSGRAHGRHEEHWLAAEKKIEEASKVVKKTTVVKKVPTPPLVKKRSAKK